MKREKNLFAFNDYLNNTIDYLIPKPPVSEHKLSANTFDKINRELTWPIPGGQEDDYAYGLQNKIASLKPTKGLVFKLLIP